MIKMKKLYFLDDYERRRILELHSLKKKSHINEQGPLTYYGAMVPTSVTDFALGPISVFYKTYNTINHASTRTDKVAKIDAYCTTISGGSLKKPAFDDFVAATKGRGYMSDRRYQNVLSGLRDMDIKDFCETANVYLNHVKTPLIHKFLEYIYSIDAENEVLNTILDLIPPPPPNVETDSNDNDGLSDESSSPPSEESSDESSSPPSEESDELSTSNLDNQIPRTITNDVNTDYITTIGNDYVINTSFTPTVVDDFRKLLNIQDQSKTLTQNDINVLYDKINLIQNK